MGITEIIAFVLRIIGWFADFSAGKKQQAEQVLGDITHEMKKKAEAVKLYKESVRQSMEARLKRKEILKEMKKKDPTTLGDQ
jgi:hypothetical protein